MNAKLHCFFATLALLVNFSIADASTFVWTNTASANWNSATNWNPNSVPGSTDTAIITNAGVTVTLNSATTVGGIILGTNGVGPVTLALNGQTLTLNGPLTVNPSGSFTVDSGLLTGNSNAVLNGTIGWTGGLLGGTLTLAANGALNLTTTGNHDMPNCTFTNNGTVTWNDGPIRIGGPVGTTIYNNGLWTMQNDQTMSDSAYGYNDSTFNNYGTVRKSGGAGTSTATFIQNVVFNQLAGVIDVQNGTNGLVLDFQNGGNFTGGYITTNANGFAVLSIGSFTINGTVTGTNTLENTGNLVGNNVINGALTWVGGVWNGAGFVTIATNSTVYVAGGGGTGNNDMPNTVVTNNGTVQWVSGTIRIGGPTGTTICNNGLWNMQSDQTMSDNGYGYNNGTFNNYGTFRKSGGAGTTTATFIQNVAFNQLAGAIDVQNGTNGLVLDLQDGGNFTGGYITTNVNGFAVLSIGSFTINGTKTSTNTLENTGNLVGNNVINGALTWVGGVWNGAGFVTIAANSTVYVAGGGGNNDMANTVVTNNGTVQWVSGTIRIGGSGATTIYNNGLWNMQSDQTMSDNGYGYNNGTFNNYGTFRKSGGAGTSTATFIQNTVFNQLAGVIDVQNGANGLVVNFQNGGNFTGGYITTNVNGFAVLSVGSFTINGTVTGTNTLESSGNLVGNNVINGGLTWVGANGVSLWNFATVTILANSTVIAAGGSQNDLNGSTVTNYGTFTWANGTLRGGTGGVVYNYGLWDAQNDQVFNLAYGGAAETFNNYGTFRKSGGGPEFTNATYFQSGVVFNQLAGVIDVQNGTNGLQLDFQSGGSFTGGYITTNQFGLTVFSVGNFNLNGTVTGTNTWEDNGNLTGNCVINGALTWVGGSGVSLWNFATVTILANSQVIATGGSQNDLNGSTVTNYGTFTWANATLRGGTGGVVYNYGFWNAQSDQTFNQAYGGAAETFNNYGTFRKSGGAGEFVNNTLFTSGVVFNQLAGMIDVQNSTNGLQMALEGNGNFTGGFVATNTQGLLNLASGSFVINGTVTDTNTWLNGATLTGTNAIQGALTWTAGTLNPANSVTIATNTTLIVAGGSGNNMDLNSVMVTNNGTVAWASGLLRGGDGSTVYNNGLWDCQSDQTFNDAFGGTGTFFDNYGTFRKSGGGPEFTNDTAIASGVVFNQLAGKIDVQNSTNGLQLALAGGGNFTGGFVTTNSQGLLNLAGGYFVINGTVTDTNTWLNGADLANTNLIQGALTWTAGTLNPAYSVAVASNATLIVAGGNGVNMDLNAVLVTNNGTVDWSSGTLRGGDGSTVFNNGIWNAQSDQIFNNAFGGTGTFFNNTGTFVKTAGVNNGSGSQIQSGVAFNNSGRLDAQAGVISLQGTYTLTNGTINFGLNSLTNYGEVSLAGAAPLTGTLSANLNNSYYPIEGNSFTNLYYGSFTGGFTNAVLPFADAWTTNYYATYFVLTVENSRPVFAALPTNLYVMNELTLLSVTNTATDADLPAQTLTYSLAAGINGMTVNPANGVFAWTPQPTNTASTNLVSVAVTDNGTPPLSATNTFTIIVRETNQAPVLPVIGTQFATLLKPFSLTNSATEPNPDSITAGYYLQSAPAGAGINASGVITWTPQPYQTLTTNTITTVVTNSNPYDAFNPHLRATNSFKVIVVPNQSAIDLTTVGLGGTNLTLNWPTDHTGWRLEVQTNTLLTGIGSSWVPVTGSSSTNQVTVPITLTNGAVFYRILYP